MWYKKNLRQVHQARGQAKQQQNQLLKMELHGVLALSLHTMGKTLTLPITNQGVTGQVIDVLREMLRERRVELKVEAEQLQTDWRESKHLRERDRAILRAARSATPPPAE
jgi:hypothetical protein